MYPEGLEACGCLVRPFIKAVLLLNQNECRMLWITHQRGLKSFFVLRKPYTQRGTLDLKMKSCVLYRLGRPGVPHTLSETSSWGAGGGGGNT